MSSFNSKWHKESFDGFMNKSLPKLLSEIFPVVSYSVEESKEYFLEMKLVLSNNKGDRLISLSAVDSKYSEFDRITIHGGKPYYIDEIKIITMG